MAEPSDEAMLAAGQGHYASDRHLLLQEIQSLAKEVARLRGDTRYLNEVVIPKEEHARRRKVNSILAGLSLALFAIAATGLYVQGQKISQTQDQVQQASYQECKSDEAAAARQGKGIVEINALLVSLRNARESLRTNPDASPAAVEVATKEVAAYERYLKFVQDAVATQGPAPKFDCDQYLDR